MKLKIIAASLAIIGSASFILGITLVTSKLFVMLGIAGFAASLWLEYLIKKKK